MELNKLKYLKSLEIMSEIQTKISLYQDVDCNANRDNTNG